jgi:predicted dehydrogenase
MMAEMRGLIVGAGAMGRAWGKNLRDCPEAEFAGWVDIRPDAAAEASAELQVDGIYTGTDFAQAVKQASPDFVVDVTIPEAHCDVTLAALACGLPVLGEKPMASSMDEARRMVEASGEAGKLYMVSQSRRYDARIQAYRRLIRERVGPLGMLNVDFYIGPHFGGFRDEMPSPLLLDMAIHTMDQARYISGEDPVSVYCEEFNPAWSWYKGDASAQALFEMTGGLRYNFRGSWCAEGRHTAWDGDWRAVGPNGTATWDGEHAPVAEIVTERGEFLSKFESVTEEPSKDVPPGIRGSLLEFLHALRTGETPNGECHDNIKSLAMVFAAIESARAGQRVRVEV